MIHPGERGGTSPLLRLVIRAHSKLALLRDDIAVGSIDLTRFALVGVAIGLQTLVLYSPGHFQPAPNAYFALQVTLGTLASLAIAGLAGSPLVFRIGIGARKFIAVGSLALLCMLAVVGIGQTSHGVALIVQGAPPNNDGAVMDRYAATQVLQGHNPYLKSDLVRALAALNAPATTTTPLIDGQFRGSTRYPSPAAVERVFVNHLRYRPRTIPPEFESKYNYPSGSFLFILPFVWAGLHDMRFLYALAVLVMGFYLWNILPRSLRILVPLLVLADVPLLALTSGGQPDPIYGLCLLVGYAEWRRSRLSPLLMGLAIATKQLAWFFMPFYLVLIWQRYGWKECGKRLGITSGIFLLLNGPFIAQSPGSYVSSIGGPVLDPMYPLGIGVVALFVAGVLPMLPKVAFTVAEILAWGASITASIRLRVLPVAAGVVFGALPLFFAWRSLVNYFYLVPLLVLAVTFANVRHSHDYSPFPVK